MKAMHLLGTMLSLLASCIIFLLNQSNDYTSRVNSTSTAVVVFFIISLMLDYINEKRPALTPFRIFYVALFIFNLGYSLTNHTENGPNFFDFRLSRQTVAESLYYSSLAFVFFFLGSQVIIKHKIGFTRGSFKNRSIIIVNLLTILSLPFLIYETVDKMLYVGDNGYFAYFARESTSVIYSIASTLSIMGGMLLLVSVAVNKNRIIIKMCIMITILIALINIFLGFRSDGILSLIFLAYFYDRYVKRINYAYYGVIFLTLFSLIIPLVAQYRDSISTSGVNLSLKENAFYSTIREMGGTFFATGYTIAILDQTHEYRNGMSYIYALQTALPFKVIPVDMEVARPSLWLVKNADPAFYRSGGGLGFSMIAETFFNFGFYFGLIGMFIQGFAMRIFSTIVSKYPYSTFGALNAAYASILIFYVRQEFFGIVRAYVLFVILLYLLIHILERRGEAESTHVRRIGEI